MTTQARREAAQALDLLRKASTRLQSIDLRTTRGLVRDEIREARSETLTATERLEMVLAETSAAH